MAKNALPTQTSFTFFIQKSLPKEVVEVFTPTNFFIKNKIKKLALVCIKKYRNKKQKDVEVIIQQAKKIRQEDRLYHETISNEMDHRLSFLIN